MHTYTDMYAFGILMWEMLAGGIRPYSTLKPEQIAKAVCAGARPIFRHDAPLPYRWGAVVWACAWGGVHGCACGGAWMRMDAHAGGGP